MSVYRKNQEQKQLMAGFLDVFSEGLKLLDLKNTFRTLIERISGIDNFMVSSGILIVKNDS
jgi:hypothetical protein